MRKNVMGRRKIFVSLLLPFLASAAVDAEKPLASKNLTQALAVSAEFSPVNIQDVSDFFKVLEKAELVKLKKI